MCGCIYTNNNIKDAVNIFFNIYRNNGLEVKKELDDYLSKQRFEDYILDDYESVYLRQYSNLKYNIESSSIDNDKASVDVIINVFDYYNALKEANYYISSNMNEFINTDGDIDIGRIIKYRINNLLSTEDRVDYLLTLYLKKDKNTWKVSRLSNKDLMKLHGVLEY